MFVTDDRGFCLEDSGEITDTQNSHGGIFSSGTCVLTGQRLQANALNLPQHMEQFIINNSPLWKVWAARPAETLHDLQPTATTPRAQRGLSLKAKLGSPSREVLMANIAYYLKSGRLLHIEDEEPCKYNSNSPLERTGFPTAQISLFPTPGNKFPEEQRAQFNKAKVFCSVRSALSLEGKGSLRPEPRSIFPARPPATAAPRFQTLFQLLSLHSSFRKRIFLQ